jgi:hypothetical protein
MTPWTEWTNKNEASFAAYGVGWKYCDVCMRWHSSPNSGRVLDAIRAHVDVSNTGG